MTEVSRLEKVRQLALRELKIREWAHDRLVVLAASPEGTEVLVGQVMDAVEKHLIPFVPEVPGSRTKAAFGFLEEALWGEGLSSDDWPYLAPTPLRAGEALLKRDKGKKELLVRYPLFVLGDRISHLAKKRIEYLFQKPISEISIGEFLKHSPSRWDNGRIVPFVNGNKFISPDPTSSAERCRCQMQEFFSELGFTAEDGAFLQQVAVDDDIAELATVGEITQARAKKILEHLFKKGWQRPK